MQVLFLCPNGVAVQLWDKQEGETSKAFTAFTNYIQLGDRSQAKLAEKLGKSSGYTRQLETWSSTYNWVQRAEAYDAHINTKAREKADADVIERRAKLQKREWEASEKLIDRALEILKLPLTQRTVTDTKKNEQGEDVAVFYTIEPVNFTGRDAARLMDSGSKLGRLSTGMTTDTQRRELTGKDGEPLPGAGAFLDLSALDDTELEHFHTLYAKATRAQHRAGEVGPEVS